MKELLLLTLTAAAGLSTASSQDSPQFHFIYEEKTFSEAQKYCREKYTDLVTVSSMDDVNALKQSYTPRPNGRVWIGLYDDVNSWRWSMSNELLYRTAKDEFKNWASDQPNNYRGSEHCASIWDFGLWYDTYCGSTRTAICFTVRGLNVTFHFISITMNWTEAQSYCRTHHTDLASVKNQEDNQRVKELFPAGQRVWIGLFRDGWKWSDGSNLSFTHWNEGEPNNNNGNEECGAADLNNMGRWADTACESKFPFVCYGDPVKRLVIKVRLQTGSSSLDLNHLDVLESILKQIKQKMKDQGQTADIELSWKKQADGNIFHKEEEEEEEDPSCEE